MGNKYNLSDDNHSASDGVVIKITVTYDKDEDRVFVDVGRRNDVADDDLLHRLSQQVENAMRHTSKLYAEEMRFIEILGGIGSDGIDGCGCNKGSCGQK
jgi:hypothetical protein